MSNIPPLPATVNASNQSVGTTTISQPTYWMTTGASTGVFGGGHILVNTTSSPRKARRPREKRQIPLFTAGLEAKLNKNLDQPANRIIRFISKKVGQTPVVVNDINETTYEYNATFTYATTVQHTVKFYAKLSVRPDGTLCEYEVRMGGAKR